LTKIYHNQLQTTLNQGVKPLWLIFGDEPWQKNDSLALIKNHAQQQGFSELIRFSADDKFDWQQVTDEYQAMSLFASQRIIEIECINGKINDAGSKVLLSLMEQLHQDVLLIFHGPKLDGPTTNRKWFKTLSKYGCYLPLYDIEAKALYSWLQKQARRLQVNLSPDVSTLLIELFEGNLLALEQELQKLSLLFNQQLIQLEDAERLLINQAKFNPFQLIDNLLQGNCQKCITILDQLQQEGSAIGQLIWFVHKEIQQLFSMLTAIKQGQPINDLYKQYRIWDKRKPLYHHALNHISLENCQHAMARLAQCDLISKTTSDFNAFIILGDVCLSLYHGQQLANLPLDYEYS
jgi:DNA polymerase-3 subunit delta